MRNQTVTTEKEYLVVLSNKHVKFFYFLGRSHTESLHIKGFRYILISNVFSKQKSEG